MNIVLGNIYNIIVYCRLPSVVTVGQTTDRAMWVLSHNYFNFFILNSNDHELQNYTVTGLIC